MISEADLFDPKFEEPRFSYCMRAFYYSGMFSTSADCLASPAIKYTVRRLETIAIADVAIADVSSCSLLLLLCPRLQLTHFCPLLSSSSHTLSTFHMRTQMRAFFFAAMALEQALELTHALHELLTPPPPPAPRPSRNPTLVRPPATAATAPTPGGTSPGAGPVAEAVAVGSSSGMDPGATDPARRKPGDTANGEGEGAEGEEEEEEEGPPITTTSCEACSGPCWQIVSCFVFARPLLGWMVAEAIWRHSILCTRTGLRSARKGVEGVRELLRVRDVQAAIKYYIACAIMLIMTLVIQHYKPHLLAGPPIFGYIATAAVMSEKVRRGHVHSRQHHACTGGSMHGTVCIGAQVGIAIIALC